MVLTRDKLIDICKRAVVPYYKWNDRDSYSAQLGIQSIYAGLTGGVKFKYNIEGRTIWITFEKPTTEQRNCFEYLEIDSLEDYRDWYINEYDSDPEMFDGVGIYWDSTYLTCYMPTEDRLNECNGDDWY